MIEELTEHSKVREVKRVSDDPAIHSVAVEGETTYRDPAMKMDAGVRSLPVDLLERIQRDSDWKLNLMQFRTGGDYAGCFTFRLKRVEGES